MNPMNNQGLQLQQTMCISEMTFPFKLFQFLTDVNKFNLSHVASWQPHGRCFRIHDPEAFVLIAEPSWFVYKRYASFQRQLSMYGFHRVSSGPDKNSYYHPLFLRDQQELVRHIIRLPLKKNGRSFDPDFYSMGGGVTTTSQLPSALQYLFDNSEQNCSRNTIHNTAASINSPSNSSNNQGFISNAPSTAIYPVGVDRPRQQLEEVVKQFQSQQADLLQLILELLSYGGHHHRQPELKYQLVELQQDNLICALQLQQHFPLVQPAATCNTFSSLQRLQTFYSNHNRCHQTLNNSDPFTSVNALTPYFTPTAPTNEATAALPSPLVPNTCSEIAFMNIILAALNHTIFNNNSRG